MTGRSRASVVEPGWLSFACAVLARVPRLEGAACISVRGRFHEAESGSRVRIAECISICRRCPARSDCARWAATERDLVGVVAGEFRGGARRDDGDDETPSEAR
jgi:WhiB family redox-sensing transcriptional regulator